MANEVYSGRDGVVKVGAAGAGAGVLHGYLDAGRGPRD